MKKIAFTLLLAAGLQANSQSVLAQEESSNHPFSFGVTAGYNASTQLDDDYIKVGSGFNVGVMGLYTFAECKVGHVIVEPAVLYSRECYKLDIDKMKENASYTAADGTNFPLTIPDEKYYQNHVKVPVQVGYEFKLGDKVTLGPKVGLEYDHAFSFGDYDGFSQLDTDALNLVEGLNVNYMKRFRLSLGWQSNLKYLGSNSGDKEWVNFNANIAYLLF